MRCGLWRAWGNRAVTDRRKGSRGRRYYRDPELTRLRHEVREVERRARTRRSKVLKRYARTNADGVPITCPIELSPNGRKVIFDTAKQADSAAVELMRLAPCRLESYPCRGREHYHLGSPT